MWTRRPALRWLVPGMAAALVIGGGAAANALAATDDPDLPPRSAAALLVELQTAQVGAFSGTLVANADLGLPALPDSDDHGGADLGSLWSGSNTLRVWYDGPERVRVALLGTLSQADIIRNGEDLWIWESGENKASHRTLPEGVLTHPSPVPVTPQEAVDDVLAEIEPTTEVSAEGTTRVAGRDAYELVVAPRDEASLIREIRLAIDAEHSIPLRVQVYGSGAEPAYELSFTQISFAQPDPEQFQFNPPPGVEVTEAELLPELPFGEVFDTPPQFTVVGEGWTQVLVVRLPEDVELGMIESLLAEGQALTGPLFSVLLTEDGRVLVGAVTAERLAEVADDPAAALEGE
jgi:outer membrane lipoprotein-sorting protein